MIEVCRVEKWTVNEHGAVDAEYDELYFIVKVAGTLFWFDECLDVIDSPFIGTDYDLRSLGRIINSRANGTFKASPTVEYDIIYYEDGVIPYNRHEDIDYKELLERLLIERGYIMKMKA